MKRQIPRIACALAVMVIVAVESACESRHPPGHTENQAADFRNNAMNANNPADSSVQPLHLTDEQWRQRLTEEQYHVLREKGTEPAFSGEYVDTKTPGVYLCAGCGLPLFDADTKFDSGSGWPSFYQPIQPGHVAEKPDHRDGGNRTEILCARCGGHLGHVFNDGPQPTGLRYCVDSLSLKLQPKP